MSTQKEFDHSTPAQVSFKVALQAAHDNFICRRLAWPEGSTMLLNGSSLYVTTKDGFAVHLSDDDREAVDWIIRGPRG